MSRLPYDDQLTPLNTDSLIEERVRDLIGRANLRQLWLLFLDVNDMQLPLLIPIDGLPAHPEAGTVATVIDNVVELMADIGAVGLVLVWERYGAATLTAQDIAWAHELAEACTNARVRLRAMLLSHRSGVRWIAVDDYCA
ncbi:MAG: hypothetical protein JWQ43_2945 [Glaciihabitans sp.]|nr:hypothetical protein [Glaciihabitans sp.]